MPALANTIYLNYTALPGVADFGEDEVFLDVYTVSYAGRKRRNIVPKAQRSFQLHWIGLTDEEVADLETLVTLASKNIVIFHHPTEKVSGAPAEFPVIVNPKQPGLNCTAIPAYVLGPDNLMHGPVVWDVTLSLVTQRQDGNAAFAAIDNPTY